MSPLWRHRDFRLLWLGQTVSEIGSQVTVLAFPTLAVLTLHAGPAAVGLMVAAARIPFPLISLFAGVYVDRLRKRPIMIACQFARLLILVTIPLLAASGGLALWHLYVASAAMGVFTVFFDIAYMAFVPALVESQDLPTANSMLETTMAGAGMVGPGLGGMLVQVLSAARAVLVDAASFLIAALLLLRIRHVEVQPPAAERRPVLREIAEGVRHVFGNPVLRAQVLCMGISGMLAHTTEAPLYLFAYDHLHIAPGVLGLLFAVEGVGSVLGSLVAVRVADRVGVGRTSCCSTEQRWDWER